MRLRWHEKGTCSESSTAIKTSLWRIWSKILHQFDHHLWLLFPSRLSWLQWCRHLSQSFLVYLWWKLVSSSTQAVLTKSWSNLLKYHICTIFDHVVRTAISQTFHSLNHVWYMLWHHTSFYQNWQPPRWLTSPRKFLRKKDSSERKTVFPLCWWTVESRMLCNQWKLNCYLVLIIKDKASSLICLSSKLLGHPLLTCPQNL